MCADNFRPKEAPGEEKVAGSSWAPGEGWYANFGRKAG